MKRWTPAMSTAAAALIALGCNGSTSPTNGYTTTTALADGIAQAFCACDGDGGASASDDAGVTSPDDGGGADAAGTCVARVTLAAQQQLALVTAAVAEGLMSIVPGPAADCVTAYQSAGCHSSAADGALPDVRSLVAGCPQMFVGFVSNGLRCDMTAECVAGSFCLFSDGQAGGGIATDGTIGICFGYGEAGDPCNTTADCDPAATLTCNDQFVCAS